MKPMKATPELPPPHIGEVRLLLDWAPPVEKRRILRAGTGSILLHVVGILILMLLPSGVTVRQGPHLLSALQSTPLVEPPRDLTQKAPNRGKVSKEFDLESLLPRPRLLIPPESSMPRPAPVLPSLPEPPKVDAPSPKLAQMSPQTLGGAPQMPPPPPAIQTGEKPKLAFERPGVPSGTSTRGDLLAAKSPAQAAAHGPARGHGGGGPAMEDGSGGLGGIAQGLYLPPSPGSRPSSLELLSDPMGVDFKPYLARILALVRKNWFAVIPESVHLGQQGRVVIQFAIAKNGSVPKLVIADSSGVEALDRAAVVGVSASNPFPPLPAQYRGNQVRLQFTFAYNLPSR
jgi:TonB family protein